MRFTDQGESPCFESCCAEFIVELIESDPSAKSFQNGNYELRLQVVDEAITRLRKILGVIRSGLSRPERVLQTLEALGAKVSRRAGEEGE